MGSKESGVNRLKRVVTLGIIVVGLVLILYTVVSNQSRQPLKQAPILELSTAQGESIRIGGKSDRWTFVNIWASWCGPCQEEAPALVRIANKLGNRVDFIGLNATSADTKADADQFVATYQISYTTVYDTEGKAVEAFQIAGFPTSFLINPQGKIVQKFEGPYSEKEFTKAIEAQLKKG